MGMDTEANAAWLYPLVESCLSEELLRVWQRNASRSTTDESNVNISDISASQNNSRLSQLMEFLLREVESEEKVLLARKGFYNISHADSMNERIKKKDIRVATSAGLFAGKESKCIFCEKLHDSKDCLSVRTIPLKERTDVIREKRCCIKCLRPGHIAKFCKNTVRCHVCEKGHHVVLCPQLAQLKETGNETARRAEAAEVVQNTITKNECTREIALMTLEVNIVGNKMKRVRALLDTGSQKSYILKSTVEELGLKPISSENIAHTLFGGLQIEAKRHHKFHIKVCRPGFKNTLEFEFLDQEIICGDIPRVQKHQILTELKRKRIWLSDMGSGSSKIELLIGSDIYGKLLTGNIKQLSGGLTAIETKLGWTVCGEVQASSTDVVVTDTPMFITNLAMKELRVQELWKLETIGIMDPVEMLSKRNEDELAYDNFVKNLSRNQEGRYCVGLPWINSKTIDLPSNRNIAEKRLLNITKKLRSMNKLDDYNNVFLEWQDEKVIEKVPEEELEIKAHYLPHHPVIKDSLTTNIRPVFDASCKVGRSPSLNNCLLKGPNLIEQIPAVLLRFREGPIGVVSDIRRAFLQIEVEEEDRNYLRFLWWNEQNRIQEFRHNRVVFGATCSPFLLGAVIRYHLSHVTEEMKTCAEKLYTSFYVDNCVTSVNDETELRDFIQNSTTIMAQASMELRMWEFGPNDEIDFRTTLKFLDSNYSNPVAVLCLLWDKEDDSLKINCRIQHKTDNVSKREILSITQSIFDPIGYLAPVLLPAKLLIQEAWVLKSDWDTPLPENINKGFKIWYNELKIIPDIKIPRRVGFGSKNDWTIHVFCDASQSAYAAVIYLRSKDTDRVSVQLLTAKSRLSPLKKVTIPRLELLGCVLGARLSRFVLEALNSIAIPVFYWTDSSTTLAWIRRNDEWGTFVGNRVKEICKLTNHENWHFVPGELNPADLPSRGCTPRQLLESRWWEGPTWLYEGEEKWPSSTFQADEDAVSVERKKRATVSNLIAKVELPVWYNKFSNFSKIVRILGWVMRFIDKSRKRKNSIADVHSGN